MARGLYLGVLASVVGTTLAVLGVLADAPGPPWWVWAALSGGPPPLGALAGTVFGRWSGTRICAGGIRTAHTVEPWSSVVDLRAERRGARTVVSVYLHSGRSVQLSAPYSGELFAEDPRFELKVLALSHLWRAHRFGGLPG